MTNIIEEMAIKALASLDKEIQNALWDVYYEPNNKAVWFVSAGDAYEGDDKEAYKVFQMKDGEII